MAFPINIEALLRAQTVESERLEFKSGWNPTDVVHTMCAFANDIHNLGGGYIIIGVEEQDGRAVLPPLGLDTAEVDGLQKKVVELGCKISPNYIPEMAPYTISDRTILVLWCPTGDNRPYAAPVSLSAKSSERARYIRVGSVTKRAKDDQERRLDELAARIPFDDRVNSSATLDDLDLGLMRTYLHEVKSQLYEESARSSVRDLALSMRIAKGPKEDVRPVNVGLMFFAKDPESFFPYCRIDLVIHKDCSGKNFEEIYFRGPIQNQLRNALAFIQSQVIKEYVIKREDVAEAERFVNYPYQAVEETLTNAVYHRSYEKREPIEVQIWDDRMEILSLPGPVPPVSYETLRNLSERKRIIAREYRNRRIGDFLKELNLTEGRGTGFPTIYAALEANGSPAPHFETDEEASYFLAVLYARLPEYNDPSSVHKDPNSVHKDPSFTDKDPSFTDKDPKSTDKDPSFTGKSTESRANELETLRTRLGERSADRDLMELAILYACSLRPIELKEMGHFLGRNDRYLYDSYVRPLLREGLIKMFYKGRNHPSQRYILTSEGEKELDRGRKDHSLNDEKEGEQ